MMIRLVYLCHHLFLKNGIKLKFMKNVFVVLIALTLFTCSSKEEKKAGKIEVLDVAGFTQIMKEDVLVVDVRTAKEYEGGFIEGAVNIDIKQSDFEKRMGHFNRNMPIVLYCAKGARSARAAKKLQAMGFHEVYDFKGGFLDWRKPAG